MDDTALLKRRLTDAANRAYTQNIYCYTNFLSVSELAVYHGMKKELSFIASETFGGAPSCERQLIRFGCEQELGYTESVPIDVVCVTPLADKFAENLSHRDYLGAVLNLGIDRSLIGDIAINGHVGYIYCLSRIAAFVADNLHTVKHTHVKCHITSLPQQATAPVLEEFAVIAASERADAVAAALCKLSRNAVTELFRSGKVFLNGICCQNHSVRLKPGDILVIRGMGKYIYEGLGNETRKGRVYIRLKKYV